MTAAAAAPEPGRARPRRKTIWRWVVCASIAITYLVWVFALVVVGGA